jgi:hypothetical protein
MANVGGAIKGVNASDVCPRERAGEELPPRHKGTKGTKEGKTEIRSQDLEKCDAYICKFLMK